MGLNRRDWLTGFGATGLAGLTPAVPARAQNAPPDDLAALQPEAQALVANLITRMAARVRVNEAGPFTFVIDTGAARTAVSDVLAASLALPPGPTVLVHGLTEAALTPTVRLARLEFGPRRFRDLEAPVFPRDSLGADGLLGLDVLSRYRLTINVVRRTVQIAPSGSDLLGAELTRLVPTRLRREGIGVRRARFGQMVLFDVAADDVPVEAFVDSGSQYSLGNMALYRSIAVRRPDWRERHWRAPLYGVTGDSLEGDLAVVEQLRIAHRQLGPTPVLFADLHAFEALDLIARPALLIGADLIGRFASLSIDFARSRMEFGPVLRRPPPPSPLG